MSRINHNLIALTTANTLRGHYGSMEQSVKRLSSGLRIDSSADDAAGLAIRELMRADIAALNKGVRNANDAISMLQVADGALSIIDEKLIRMKELAEQSATGTYDSTQRLMIHSEFVAMGEEIDRIARSTDFNGIKLLDGSLKGKHNGGSLNATGAIKIHFGTNNDSAEDYYYVEIGDCTTAGLGLRGGNEATDLNAGHIVQNYKLNDRVTGDYIYPSFTTAENLQDIVPEQGKWVKPNSHRNPPQPGFIESFICIIPKGMANVVINTYGTYKVNPPVSWGDAGDQDIQIFTKTGKHLAGTPLDDFVYLNRYQTIDYWSGKLGFTSAQYDGQHLNSGPSSYDPTCQNLQYSSYNGMVIGYSGDPDRHDASPNDGIMETWEDYEVLTIDKVTEDLVLFVNGAASFDFKVFYDASNISPGDSSASDESLLSLKTQEQAQSALPRMDEAIAKKDKIRAHLGAMQNRLENTVANLSIQSENLMASESRISDVDVAVEMSILVRNQILTQAAVAMLGQANSYPHMLSGLINW